MLYHLRHPLLALDILRRLTRRQMVLQTLTMPGEEPLRPPETIGLFQREWLLRPGWPRMAFIERTLEDDPTTWWEPDRACVEAMVRCAGFKVTAWPGHEIYVCEPDEREPVLGKQLRELELRAVTRGGVS